MLTIESYIKSQLPKDAFLEQIAQKAVSEKYIDQEYDKLVKELKGKKRIKVSFFN